MKNKSDFEVLVNRALVHSGRAHMKPVIEKEILHYDILFALDNEGLLDKLTFQGGTALRLCYGAQRFSEDLDFTGGKQFSANDLASMKACLEHYIGKRHGLTVQVKEPSTIANTSPNEAPTVSKWQINIITAPEHRDIPQQKIKIEIINIPSYTNSPCLSNTIMIVCPMVMMTF